MRRPTIAISRYGKKHYRFSRRDDGFYFNNRYGYYHPTYGLWNQSKHCWWDLDDNPPGSTRRPGHELGKSAGPARWSECEP